ncbi:hypothetical protein [Halococcus agarilyticus]|uniref:hypothetical protein n=1 Tax=Halococcus agarilyticus TaxID=1232219 RepID=UPI000677F9EA|nr:hypothetical protein [Halococcus agarilyticus]
MTKLLDTRRESLLSLALAALVLVSAGSAVTFTANAAGSTTVSLSPTEQRVDTGETTTYEVVVENTDGGIGTTDAAVTLDDPSVGSITDLTIAGEPANENIAIADDGSSASFDAVYFGNALSDDPGGVVIATVTVRGTEAGSSGLSLDVTEISDAAGDVYDVTGTDGASLAVGGQVTTTETPTETPTTTRTPTETGTPTTTQPTATETETSTTTQTTTGTETTTTAIETTTQTTTTAGTTTETETETPAPTTTATETETTTTETTTTASPTSTDTETTTEAPTTGTTSSETTTAADTTTATQTATETTTTADDGERTLDGESIADSLADSDLDDTQTGGVSTALDTSDLSDAEITAITDALASDDLSGEQRETIADAVAAGDLSDEQLRALADALSDGRLTDAERDALGFLGEAGVTYYQVDFVTGEPIEELRGPEGTYTEDQLIRFAHGSTEEPIVRRSAGEFTTDHVLADRIESQDIEVTNGTATTTFTVAEGESITLTLASYEKIGPGWSPETEALQEFVDSETRTFESGTHTLTVDLPDEDGSNGTE